MAQIIPYRGFIIEVHKDYSGANSYYVKARKQDGIMLHHFDVTKCKMHETQQAAMEQGEQLINVFLDTPPVTFIPSIKKIYIK